MVPTCNASTSRRAGRVLMAVTFLWQGRQSTCCFRTPNRAVRYLASVPIETQQSTVRLWIGDGDLNVHASEVDAPETFEQMQRLAVWVSGVVQPGFLVDAIGFDNKR